MRTTVLLLALVALLPACEAIRAATAASIPPEVAARSAHVEVHRNGSPNIPDDFRSNYLKLGLVKLEGINLADYDRFSMPHDVMVKLRVFAHKTFPDADLVIAYQGDWEWEVNFDRDGYYKMPWIEAAVYQQLKDGEPDADMEPVSAEVLEATKGIRVEPAPWSVDEILDLAAGLQPLETITLRSMPAAHPLRNGVPEWLVEQIRLAAWERHGSAVTLVLYDRSLSSFRGGDAKREDYLLSCYGPWN